MPLNKTRNARHTPYAQKLRREMTKEEKHLWFDFLKGLPVNVNRQKVIGPYIVDFYCASYSLVIELDGSQHYEETGIIKDQERDQYLNGLGFRVLRFSNYDVNHNFRGVCGEIMKAMDMEI